MRSFRPSPLALALALGTAGTSTIASADPPSSPASSTSPAREARRAEASLPQACEQDPFHVDYGAIREGSLVRLGRHRSVDGNANWDPSMEHYVGRTTPVVSARGLDPQGCAIVEVAADGGEYVWRVRDLEIVAGAPDTTPGSVPELRVSLGAVPDPRVFDTTLPELTRRANTVESGCAGWIGARPTFTLVLDDEFSTLSLMVRSRVDAILVVRKPDGDFVCVDDVDGRDPVLSGRASAGRYEVFVGAYEPTEGNPPVRIGISERSTVRAASLDTVRDTDARPLVDNARQGSTRLRAGRPASATSSPSPSATPPAAPPTDSPDESGRRTR